MERNPIIPLAPPHNGLSQKKHHSTPDTIIDLQFAANYYNNFHNTRLSWDSSDTTKKVWFRFEMLEQYFERVRSICNAMDITTTGFSFLFGANGNNQRTVFIAPMCYDETLQMDRAFSLQDGQIHFIHGEYFEDHSTIAGPKDLNDIKESLILGENGALSIAEAVALYNNYFNSKTGPISDIVKLDTRVVYYRKGEFENSIQYLKDRCKENNIGLTGIYAVFSAYDNDRSYDQYANHMTLFFAPTMQDGNYINVAFSSFASPEENLLDFSKDNWAGSDHLAEKTVSSLFNHGSSGPPPNNWD